MLDFVASPSTYIRAIPCMYLSMFPCWKQKFDMGSLFDCDFMVQRKRKIPPGNENFKVEDRAERCSLFIVCW